MVFPDYDIGTMITGGDEGAIRRHPGDVDNLQCMRLYTYAPFFYRHDQVVLTIRLAPQNTAEQVNDRAALEGLALVQPLSVGPDHDVDVARQRRVPKLKRWCGAVSGPLKLFPDVAQWIDHTAKILMPLLTRHDLPFSRQ